jgi:myo-inositol catabolism protein IolS
MQTRRMGRTDVELSPVILGGWLFGGDHWSRKIDDEESIRTIHAAMDSGITMIDTAETYGGGHSEEVIGRALVGRRERMMIATKVWETNLTREGIESSLTRSLELLQTDYVNLYQVHRPSDTIPIEESMEKLAECQADGRIQHIGLSNFSVPQMEAARRVARFETMQPPYHLFWRYIEKEELPWCQANDVTVNSYSPLAQGLLTGLLKRGDSEGRMGDWLFMPDVLPLALDAVEVVRAIAARNGHSVIEVALAWVIAQEGVVPIVGARTPEQIEGIVRAAEVVLSDDELDELVAVGDEVMAALGDKDPMWQFKRD